MKPKEAAMTQMLNRNVDLEQILRGIEVIKSKQQTPEQPKLPPKMDREKCEKFSDYITTRFIDACNHETISGRFQNWKEKSDAEKLKLAADILNVFLNNISRDITRHQVPIYRRDGDKYKPTNDEFDEKITMEMAKMPEISVNQMENAKLNDGMCITSSKDLRINMEQAAYKENPLQFLMDLRHEFTHLADIFIAEISPLDADVREEAIRNYTDPHQNKELYKNNPLELNANMKRDDYKQRIDAMLTLQEVNRNRTMNINMLGMMGRGYGRAA